MSKICLNCGHEADDNAKFCIRCGSRFSDKSAEIEKSEAADRAERSDKSERLEENAVFPDAEKQRTVEELTGRDFSSSADGAAKAEAPSEERRIGAEWQGSDCRCFGDAGSPSGTTAPFYGRNPYQPSDGNAPRPLSPQEYEAQRLRQVAQARSERALNVRKLLFVLAFVGLLLDFVCGIGFLLCLPVAVTATVFSATLRTKEKKTSAQLVWAMVVGYVGAVLGLVFFILMV